MMISSYAFSIFSNVDLLRFRGVNGQKVAQKGKKICLSHTISEIVSHMIVVIGTHV